MNLDLMDLKVNEYSYIPGLVVCWPGLAWKPWLWPRKMWARAITGGLGWLQPGLAQAMAYVHILK